MLVNFSVSNFSSFKDKVTLSMEKTAIQKHKAHILDNGLLSGVAIYGANASGKTNLLRAIGLLPMFVNPQSVLYLNSLNSFMMRPDIPTEFEVEFVSNNIKYLYKVSFNSSEIINEELSFVEKARITNVFGTKQNLVYKRSGVDKEFGKLFQYDWYLNRSFPKDITLLSKILSDGVIDNDIKHKEHFINVADFMSGIAFFDPKTEVPMGMLYDGFKQPEFKKFLCDLLRQADLGITDIEFKFMGVVPAAEATKDPQLSQMVEGRALIRQQGDDYFIFTIDKGQVKRQMLIVKHGDVHFGLSKESAGTIKLFKFGFLLYTYRKEQGSIILLLDEFDSLFHPFLTKLLLKGLLNNPMSGQIIAALHNTMLLSHEIWRVDEIWFTEKDEDGASRLYPLTDINPRFDKDLEKDYINGRYGAVPFLGGEELWRDIIK